MKKRRFSSDTVHKNRENTHLIECYHNNLFWGSFLHYYGVSSEDLYIKPSIYVVSIMTSGEDFFSWNEMG